MLAWGQFMKSRQQRRRQQREWILGLRMLGMQGFARVSSERRHLSSISRHTNSTNSSCCREIHPQTISEKIHLAKFEKYSFRIWEIQFTEPGSTSTGLTAASATVLLSGEFLVKVEVLQKIDPQDTLLGFSFAGQLRIGGLPKNFQPLHISKYLLPNMTLLLWLNVPSCCLSNLPVVLPHTCKLDSVTVWQKNQFYIPMQGDVSHVGALKKTMLGVKLLHCSSLAKYPHIHICRGDIWGRDTFKGDLSMWETIVRFSCGTPRLGPLWQSEGCQGASWPLPRPCYLLASARHLRK